MQAARPLRRPKMSRRLRPRGALPSPGTQVRAAMGSGRSGGVLHAVPGRGLMVRTRPCRRSGFTFVAMAHSAYRTADRWRHPAEPLKMEQRSTSLPPLDGQVARQSATGGQPILDRRSAVRATGAVD